MSKKRISAGKSLVDASWRIGIVAARYHEAEVDALIASARQYLVDAGIKRSNIVFIEAPGCFELPLLSSLLIKEERVDAIVALGVLLEGETSHATTVATTVANALMALSLQYGIPVAHQVLHVQKLLLAQKRHSAGAEGARAVLHVLAEKRNIMH